MVTIQEAVLEVEEAREELKSAKGSALEREKEIQLAKSQSQLRLSRSTNIGTISSQISLAAAVGAGGVRREIKTRRRVARKEFKETRGRISKAREELETFEMQLGEREREIGGVETQIKSAQQQQAEQIAIQRDIESAKKIVRGAGFDPGASPRIKKFIREIRAGQEISALQPTQTEIDLQLSLPTGLRDLPPTEIVSGLPGTQIFAGQSLLPSTDIKSLGGVFLKRSEFEVLTQQSVPLGTFGIIPQEDVRELGVTSLIPVSIREFVSGEDVQRERARRKLEFQGREFQFSFAAIGKKGTPFGVIVPESELKSITPIFEESITREARGLQLGTTLQSAVFLSFAGAGIASGKTLRIPLRERQQPSFIEIQQPVIFKGRPETISTFRITEEISPPTFVGSKTGGLFGGRIQPAKLEITTTPFKTFDKLPVFTLTTRGGGIGKLDILTGDSKAFGLSEIRGISPRQQFLVQRFAERFTQGRPVALKNLPKVLRKDLEFDLGNLQSFKLGRIDVGRTPTRIDLLPVKQLGRRRTQFETFSGFRKVAETDQFQLFKGTTLFKDITKPFARARGKTPELKGFVIRRKQPIIFGEEGGIISTRLIGRKRTPLEKTFAKQFQLQELKLLPKPPPGPKAKRVSLKVSKPSGIGGISSLLFGVSGGVSFRTNIQSFGFGSGFGVGFGKVAQPTKAKERFGGRITQPEFLAQDTFTFEKQISIQQPKLSFALEQAQVPKQIQTSGLRIKEALSQRKALKLTQKQIPKQTLIPKLKLAQKQIPKLPRPVRPRPSRIGKHIPNWRFTRNRNDSSPITICCTKSNLHRKFRAPAIISKYGVLGANEYNKVIANKSQKLNQFK